MAKREEFRVDLTANDQASGTIDGVAAKLESVTGSAEVEITATDEATEVIEGVEEEVEGLDGANAEAELTADDEASEVVGDVTEAVEELDGATAEAELDADDQASEVVAEAEGAVEGFDTASGSATLDAEDNASDTIDEVLTSAEAVDDTFTATLETEGAEDAETEAGGVATELGKGATAAAGIVAGLMAVGTAASDQILEIASLATAIDSPLEKTSAMVDAWEMAGGNVDSLERNINKVNNKLRESPALAAALGIEITENMTPLDVFIEAVSALNSGQLTANERLALATELFGTRGVALLNDFEQRVGDINEAIENAPDDAIIDQDDVDRAQKFAEQWDAVGDKIGSIGRDLLPAANLALEGLLGLMDGSWTRWWEDFANSTLPPWLDAPNPLDELMPEGDLFETATPDQAQIDLVNEYLATHDALGNVVLPGTVAALDEVAGATEDAAAAAEMHAERLEEQRDALEESAEAQRDLIDATRDATDTVYAARSAQRDFRQQIRDTAAALVDEENSADDDAAALDDLALSAADSARQQAVLSGAAENSSKFIEIENASLLGMASNLNGPMRDAVLAYIRNVNDIPTEVMTEIEAALNRGDLAEAERLLNNASRTRTAAIKAQSDDHQVWLIENRLNNLARARYVSIIARGSGVGGGPRAVATGHPFTPPGWYLSGEQGGPELIELGLGAKVHSAAQTAGIMDGRGSGPPVVNNITINAPAGTRAGDVAASIRRYARIQAA